MRAIALVASPCVRTCREKPSVFCMEWNAENQLIRVTKNTIEQARFKYDPLGRRVEKVAGGVTTGYTYEGQDILRESTGAGSVIKYVHGQDVDEPMALEDGAGVLTCLHTDGLGSIVKHTSASGAVTLSRQYDAFGNLQVGATTPGYAFTGREWDPEADLHYYRARYYSSKLGRFLSEDRVRWAVDPNLYPYVGNNPANALDPSGLFTTKKRRKPPTNRNSIVCDGKDNVTLHLPLITPDTPECLADCARRHEKSHKEDADASNPGVCRKVPAGIVVEYSSPKERRSSERKGCDIQLECLKGYLKCPPTPECNKPTLEKSVEIVKADCAQVTQ